MRRTNLVVFALAFVATLLLGRTAQAQVDYGPWQKTQQGNYYRVCKFPKGGHQYLFWFKAKPEWVYWYNPDKQVYWSCCPTIKHPDYKDEVKDQKDLFLIAIVISIRIEDCVFPDAPPGPGGSPSPNFKTTVTAKDKDNSDVKLQCPPVDLPPGV